IASLTLVPDVDAKTHPWKVRCMSLASPLIEIHGRSRGPPSPLEAEAQPTGAGEEVDTQTFTFSVTGLDPFAEIRRLNVVPVLIQLEVVAPLQGHAVRVFRPLLLRHDPSLRTCRPERAPGDHARCYGGKASGRFCPP